MPTKTTSPKKVARLARSENAVQSVKKTAASKKSLKTRVNAPVKKVAKNQTVPMKKTNVFARVKQALTQQQVMQYGKNPRFWVGVVVVVLAILLYVYKGLFIAATVNGQPISRLSVISQLEQQGGKQELDTLIAENLVLQEAKKRNITIPQSQINAEIATIEAQLKGQGTTLDAALAARGMSRSDLVQQMEIQDLLNKMVGSSVTVTDAQIQSYIDQNKDSLPQGLSDADLKAQVKSQLEQQELQSKTQAFLANLQKNAKVTYFVNY